MDISGYARQMTAHCPYLTPSRQQGLTTWTVYRADRPTTKELTAAW
ncbi:hypothetical protein ACWGOK_33915 [Streptomyces eurythermus]